MAVDRPLLDPWTDDPHRPEPVLAGAADLLAAALDGTGAVAERWAARQVTYRPGRSLDVCWEVGLRFADGRRADERVAVHVGRRAPSGPGVARLEGDDGVVAAAWTMAHDPALPALRTALDPAGAALLLEGAHPGLGPVDPSTVSLAVRAYRPRRRAVVEVVAPDARLFVKVVPPGRAEALHERHRLLEGHVPVPPSLGHRQDGLLVMAALPGRTLRQAVMVDSGPVPSLRAVTALLDRLPPELADLPGAPGSLARVADHAALLAAVAPDERDRLARLVVELAPTLADVAADGPVVAHHGDLYEAQLLVDGDHVIGLLDVDGAGGGHRLDDVATLVAHLSLLTQMRTTERLRVVGSRYVAEADRLVDPVALRRRVAAVLVGLATGPFRVQEPGWVAATYARLDLVDAWLDSARTVAARTTPAADEEHLMAGSG